ncbi:MAG: DUF5682 family protein [Spirochaetes bacterium]|nr:DUF5682 family protein [Spirochaetota bacterium]
MDKIELSHILHNVFSLDAPVAFFPIRHHSPACSYHVKKAIDIYKPDCVLIEGPSDTDSLIPCLNNAQPPVSIYYSYQDSEGRHACYYPMLEYSPELVAMKTAIEKNTPVHFIDLPFGSLVLGEREHQSKMDSPQTPAGRKTYYDDYFLERSRYIQSLCEKENCRNYAELWEKLFEISAASINTQTFIKNMTSLCYFSRIDYPQELLVEEQNPPREAFMAQMIIEHSKQYKRILAVTGGFHTAALMQLVDPAYEKAIEKVKPVSGNAYLIPYSFEECDQLKGYESGMPYPGYYQILYDNLNSRENDFCRKTVLLYITKLAKALRKNRENISLSEEAAAFAMGLGLAALRGKNQPSVYEFLDGIRSCFVKGELNLSTSFILSEAARLLRGEKNGKVGADAPVPPIVLDFQKQAKLFKMDISTSAAKSITLDIVSKARHREQSVFLHRLCFLENPYAKKTYGPDYEGRSDTELIREKWDYAYSGRAASALIEKSHLGGTIAEACESQLADLLKNHCHSCADAAALLVKAGVLSLFSHAQRAIDVLSETIASDHSFVSLADCIKSLSFLRGIEHILRIDNLDAIKTAEAQALHRIIPMIPSLSAGDEKEDFALAQSLKMLYQIAAKETGNGILNEALPEILSEAFRDLIARKNAPPSVDGVATGLLYNEGSLPLYETLQRSNAYFSATGDIQALSGRFLRGLFLSAKDLVFYDNGFIEGLNGIIKNLPYDEFIKLLPDLRLSFTSFSPREIDLVAKKAMEILGLAEGDGVSLTELPAIDENVLKIMLDIDRRTMDYLKKKGYAT